MNNLDKQSAFLSASIDSHIPVIDLHVATSISEALDRLETELYGHSQNSERYCKIVYGIGEGILRKEVLKIIKKHPLVLDTQEDSGGSCIALF